VWSTSHDSIPDMWITRSLNLQAARTTRNFSTIRCMIPSFCWLHCVFTWAIYVRPHQTLLKSVQQFRLLMSSIQLSNYQLNLGAFAFPNTHFFRLEVRWYYPSYFATALDIMHKNLTSTMRLVEATATSCLHIPSLGSWKSPSSDLQYPSSRYHVLECRRGMS